MDFSGTSKSTESGMYGSSNYPPIFDDEPPPMDDFDDDDDFADFQSTNVGATDWNAWPSQSCKNHKNDGKEDDSFGDFSAFDSGDNNLKNKKQDDENDDVSMKSMLSNGLPNSSGNFKSFDTFGEEASRREPTSAKIEENLKDKSNNKEDFSIKKTEKIKIETNGNMNMENMERNVFVEDNSKEINFASSERKRDKKEVTCDEDFGDFKKMNGDLTNSNNVTDRNNKMENARSLSGVPNSVFSTSNDVAEVSLQDQEISTHIGVLAKNCEKYQSSLSTSSKSSGSCNDNDSFGDFSQHASNDFNIDDDFGDFSQCTEDSTNKKSEVKSDIEENANKSDVDGVGMVVNKSGKTADGFNFKTKDKDKENWNDSGRCTEESFFADDKKHNKTNSYQGNNDGPKEGAGFKSEGDDFQDFSSFSKSELSSDEKDGAKNSTLPLSKIENDTLHGLPQLSHGQGRKSSDQVISNFNQRTESVGDKNQGCSVQKEDNDSFDSQNKLLDAGSTKSNLAKNQAKLDTAKLSSVKENIDTGHLETQCLNSGSDTFGFENPNKKTELFSDGETKDIPEDDDFGNFEDFGSLSGANVKSKLPEFESKSNSKSESEITGEFNTFGVIDNATVLEENNLSKETKSGFCTTRNDDSSGSGSACDSPLNENIDTNESQPSRTTKATLADEIVDDFGDFSELKGIKGPKLVTAKDSHSKNEDFGDFSEVKGTKGPNSVTAKEIESRNEEFGDFSEFQGTKEPNLLTEHDGKSDSNDFHDFSQSEGTKESNFEAKTNETQSENDSFGNFSEFKGTKQPNTVTAKESQSENNSFNDFSEFQSTKEPTFSTKQIENPDNQDFGDFSEFHNPREPNFKTAQDPQSISHDFGDFSELQSTKEPSLETAQDNQPDDDDFSDFSEFQNTKEPGVMTAKDPESKSGDFGDFSEFQSTNEPHLVAAKDNQPDDDDFSDFSEFQNTKEPGVMTAQDLESKSGDFGDFSEFKTTKGPSLMAAQVNQSDNDDFGDFSEIQNTKQSDFFTKHTGKLNDNTSPKSTGNASEHTSNDNDFATFQDFSKTPGDESFFPAKALSQNENWGDFSSNQDNFTSKATTQSNDGFDNFASFSKGDSTFSTVPRLQNEDDDNWASFDSARKSDLGGSKSAGDVSKANDFGDFNQRPSFPESATLQNKGIAAKLSAKLHPLLSPCFPKTNNLPSGKLPTPSHSSLLTGFLGQEKSNGLPCVWSKLIGSDEIEQSWNLSFQSSTNFKWTLTTIGVSYEHIVKKWKHSSHDTQSSLSPTSSVASFDVDSSVEPMAILVPEPAGKVNSLLKPTLLAQSQQKELDLHRVPSISSLKKGDSGSETTSETASLDLEFFSSGVASVTSSQSNKDLASLNDVNFFNIASDSISVTSADISASKRGTDSQQVAQQSQAEKASASLPFNLNALNKVSLKNNLSNEAKGFLEQLDDLKFMNSSVLMFPSQFSSE